MHERLIFWVRILLLCLTFFLDKPDLYGQDSSLVDRKGYMIAYKWALPDAMEDAQFSGNHHIIQLSRSIPIHPFITLSPGISYKYFPRAKEIKQHILSLDAMVSIYPVYIATKILGLDYDAKRDHFFMNLNLQFPFNKKGQVFEYDLDVNLFRFRLYDKLQLGVATGAKYIVLSNEKLDELTYYTIGLNVLLR